MMKLYENLISIFPVSTRHLRRKIEQTYALGDHQKMVRYLTRYLSLSAYEGEDTLFLLQTLNTIFENDAPNDYQSLIPLVFDFLNRFNVSYLTQDLNVLFYRIYGHIVNYMLQNSLKHQHFEDFDHVWYNVRPMIIKKFPQHFNVNYRYIDIYVRMSVLDFFDTLRNNTPDILQSEYIERERCILDGLSDMVESVSTHQRLFSTNNALHIGNVMDFLVYAHMMHGKNCYIQGDTMAALVSYHQSKKMAETLKKMSGERLSWESQWHCMMVETYITEGCVDPKSICDIWEHLTDDEKHMAMLTIEQYPTQKDTEIVQCVQSLQQQKV